MKCQRFDKLVENSKDDPPKQVARRCSVVSQARAAHALNHRNTSLGFPSGGRVHIHREETKRGKAYPVASGTVNRCGAHVTKGFRAPAEPRDTFNSRLRDLIFLRGWYKGHRVAASSCKPRCICLGARTVLHIDGATAPQRGTLGQTDYDFIAKRILCLNGLSRL